MVLVGGYDTWRKISKFEISQEQRERLARVIDRAGTHFEAELRKLVAEHYPNE